MVEKKLNTHAFLFLIILLNFKKAIFSKWSCVQLNSMYVIVKISDFKEVWCGRRDLNPGRQLGRLAQWSMKWQLLVVVSRLPHNFISLIVTLNIDYIQFWTILQRWNILNNKIFHGAILESILLNLINETSDHGLHGYAILKAVQKKFGILLGPSTLYIELRRLEKQGFISSGWEFSLKKAHKQYRITPKGQCLLSF